MWNPGGWMVDNPGQFSTARASRHKSIGPRAPAELFSRPVDPVADRIEAVRERVHAAVARSGRNPGAVTIVAVTKTFPAEMVRRIVAAGIADIGENRVQEMLAKSAEVEAPCRWHLVGPLQRNKAGKAAGVAHLVHALDGVAIAQTLDRIAHEKDLRVRVLLEVNTSGEATKHGVAPEESPSFVETLAALPGLDWQGLMTIGPAGGDLDEARRCFRHLRHIAEDLRRRSGLPLPELSMGMSDDFEAAIEEGATLVRIGRLITGERD